MKWIFPRMRLQALYGWLVSAVVHLAGLIIFALLLMPLAGDLWDTIEVEVAFEPPGKDLIWIETTPLPAIADERFEPGVISGGSGDFLTIDSPLATLARGQRGKGSEFAHAALKDGEGGEQGSASFFGTQAYGNRFVYVLDVSTSMDARNGKRLERAVHELLRSLDQLHDYQHFYVIVFGGNTRLMFDESGLSPSLIPATLENKRRLRQWLADVSLMGGTDPRDALNIALSIQPDAVFLLSDGEFNGRGRLSRFFGVTYESVHDVVTQANPQSIPVHTIALEDRSSEPAMRDLSELTKGIHRFVPVPEGRPPLKRKGSSSRWRLSMVSRYKFQNERPIDMEETSVDLSETTAAFWLSRADQYETLKDSAQAYECYRRILDEYPDTRAAAEAQKRMQRSKETSSAEAGH